MRASSRQNFGADRRRGPTADGRAEGLEFQFPIVWVGARPTGGSSSQVNQERPLTPLASPLERVERQVRSTGCGAQPLSCYPQNGKIARLPEFSERVLDKPVEKLLGSQ